jgi:diguanylate cyclase (GGDEF)-like protein
VAAIGFGSAMALGRSILQQWDQETEVLARRAQESRLDGLTSLLNRRGFDERLDAEIARSARFGHPLSLLLIDVDDFKLVNDRFGHAAGDEVLRSLASHIERSIRTIDIAARYGGEEFAVILPETPAEGALVVAERILGFHQPSLIGAPITVTIGVAELDPVSGSKDELIQRSDEALYRAKRAGKNRVGLAR